MKNKEGQPSNIDWTVVLVSLIFVAACSIFLFAMPEQSTLIVNQINSFIATKFGWLYIWLTLISIVLCLYMGLSNKFKDIKMGENVEKEYSEFSWAAMMFCASMAAGFIYWGCIEWAYHYGAPPFGLTPLSVEAGEYAATLPLLHWGFSAWSLYLIPSVAFAFVHFTLKQERFDVANVCREILGDRVDGTLGKVLNIFFVFGLIGGVGTALGIGSPLVSASLNNLFGLQDTPQLRTIVMIVVAAIFATSAYQGVRRGIKVLSNINVTIMISLAVIMFILGDTIFIVKMSTTALGKLFQNFIHISTYMDPINNSGHPESWLVFYLAWWMSYSVFMGLFIAKISKGRTVFQIIFGGLIYGFAGTFVFFSIWGNFFMGKYLDGSFDIVGSLESAGGPQTVIQVFRSLPVGVVFVLSILIASIISMATNFDSASYTLAMVSSKKIQLGERPGKPLTMFWAISLAAIPMVMMWLGASLEDLQVLSIILALPTCIVYGIIVASCFKMLLKYRKKSISES